MTRKADEAAFTAIACAGYQNEPHAVSPYLGTSMNAEAWHIGRWLQHTGRSEPKGVHPSRGDTWHCNGMLVRLTWGKGVCTITRER